MKGDNNMEQVKLFLEKIQRDAKLQEELKALYWQQPEAASDALVALARVNGFEITMEDLKNYANNTKEAALKNRELNEGDLDTVSGGSGSWNIDSLTVSCVISMAFLWSNDCKINR